MKLTKKQKIAHLKEVSAAIRCDIVDAIADGDLPKQLKVSIRIDWGTTMRVTILKAPFDILNAERVLFEHQTPSIPVAESAQPTYTYVARLVCATLRAIIERHRQTAKIPFYDGEPTFSPELLEAERRILISRLNAAPRENQYVFVGENYAYV